MIDFNQTDSAAGEVRVPVSQFCEKCEPLISRTIQATKSEVHSVLGDSATDFPESGLSTWLVAPVISPSCFVL
jgi:hypothetical protein